MPWILPERVTGERNHGDSSPIHQWFNPRNPGSYIHHASVTVRSSWGTPPPGEHCQRQDPVDHSGAEGPATKEIYELDFILDRIRALLW